jgi:hypothetical protein
MISLATPGERRGKQGERKFWRPEPPKNFQLFEPLKYEILVRLCG